MTDAHRDPFVAVYYEHPDWFEPLFRELERRAIPYRKIHSDAALFDPGAGAPSDAAVLFNRMSPSAGQRGRTSAVHFTTHLLRHAEESGQRVVNGTEAWRTEISKAHQISLLSRLGLPHPETRVIHRGADAPSAASKLRFPVVVKPNVGGSGAGIRRFDTPAELEAAVDGLDLGVDGSGLVQEFVPPRDGHIVRVEVVGGRYLYAIAVHPPEDGFNLCPADACVGPDGEELERTFCAADAPRSGLRVEAFEPSGDVRRQVERLTAAAGIEVGGVEYLVDDRDGRVRYYDVNALSNFVADAERVIGFDPFERLVDWLADELTSAERRPAAPASVGAAAAAPVDAADPGAPGAGGSARVAGASAVEVA